MKHSALLLSPLLLLCQAPPGGDPVQRMMGFDANHDGKLTRGEVTEERFLRLFDRADANHDGVVTREELTALFAEEAPNPRGGPGGRGMRPPEPGQILPPFLQQQLNLTADQQNKIDALQKDVDSRLESILTETQRAQLRGMRRQRPGGPPPR